MQRHIHLLLLWQVNKQHVECPHIFLAAIIEAIKPLGYEAFCRPALVGSCRAEPPPLLLWLWGETMCPTLQPLLHHGGGTSLTIHHLILRRFHITLQMWRQAAA